MATDLKRVTLYVEPALEALLRDVAELSGQSVSSLGADLLRKATPVLEVLKDLMVQLEATPLLHQRALEQIADLSTELTGLQGDGVARLVEFGSKIAPQTTPEVVTRGSR
jgi:hypothetical protein